MAMIESPMNSGEIYTIVNQDGSDFETEDGGLVSFYAIEDAFKFVREQKEKKPASNPGIIHYRAVGIFESLEA